MQTSDSFNLGSSTNGAESLAEVCHCPCCREGIEAPHEYHLERRPMCAHGGMSGMQAFDKALGSLLAHIDAGVAAGVRVCRSPGQACEWPSLCEGRLCQYVQPPPTPAGVQGTLKEQQR